MRISDTSTVRVNKNNWKNLITF